jgi:putative oxidoreductase
MHAPVKLLADSHPSANAMSAAGRFLLALIFVLAGFGKLGTVDATAAQMASHGIPFAHILVWGAITLELGGGLMLMTGLFARFTALVLGFYTLALALIFHAYWAAPAAEARTQFNAFYEHFAMIGGMLYVVASGAGAYSLDALLL